MYSVYVLYSQKVYKMYVGYASDLKQRLRDHQEGKVDATKNWRPLLCLYAEIYRNKKDALRRERFFKTGWGRRYLNKLLSNTLQELKSSKI